ncbi:alginate O-acetyltransferase AlgF [Rhizobium sullae]|nr:alginate O-acetyltransferase AlgF [Rhizobium sullae]
MKRKIQAVLIALVLGGASAGTFSTHLLANDAGLYDAPIPADKSLVRFLNVKLKNGVSLDFSGQKFDVDPVALSNYRLIGNGSYKISDDASSTEATLEPGKFYTVAVGADGAGQKGIVVIPDKEVENPSKSALSFYNFSTKPANLSLRLNGDSKVLFKNLAPAAMASKELPVIDIGLEVSEGDRKVTELAKVSLTAKDRQNVVVVETPNGPAGFLAATGIDR